MTAETLAAIAETMNLFPEVTWDRFVDFDDTGSAFGWIARDDDHADFMRIEWVVYHNGTLAFGFTTSSARHSAAFAERLYGTVSEHADCQRVEEHFGDLVANVVRLEKAEV